MNTGRRIRDHGVKLASVDIAREMCGSIRLDRENSRIRGRVISDEEMATWNRSEIFKREEQNAPIEKTKALILDSVQNAEGTRGSRTINMSTVI